MKNQGGIHSDLKGVDDFHLFLNLAQEGDIVRLEYPLVYYFEHENNLSREENIFVDGLYMVQDVLEIEDRYPTAIRAVRAQALKSDGVSQLIDKPFSALLFYPKLCKLSSTKNSFFNFTCFDRFFCPKIRSNSCK